MFPSFVFYLDVFDSIGIRTCIEIRQSLVFRHPTPIDEIAKHRLSLLIEEFDANILA
jgi:hypothetical protein